MAFRNTSNKVYKTLPSLSLSLSLSSWLYRGGGGGGMDGSSGVATPVDHGTPNRRDVHTFLFPDKNPSLLVLLYLTRGGPLGFNVQCVDLRRHLKKYLNWFATLSAIGHFLVPHSSYTHCVDVCVCVCCVRVSVFIISKFFRCWGWDWHWTVDCSSWRDLIRFFLCSRANSRGKKNLTIRHWKQKKSVNVTQTLKGTTIAVAISFFSFYFLFT